MRKTNKHKFTIDLISLLISLGSLVIACIALKSITKVEGFKDLLYKTSENTLRLDSLITEQKLQDSLQQIELNELIAQSKTLLELQKSNANQLDLQRKEDKSNLINDYLILKNSYKELLNLSRFPEDSILYNPTYREQTIKYLQDFKSIIYGGINTSLLKMHDEIYSRWCFFSEQIDGIINQLNNSEYPKLRYYNIPLKIVYIVDGQIIDENEHDVITLKDFKRYFNSFWKNGVEPMLQVKEMKYYENKYLELSNMGRMFPNGWVSPSGVRY